MSDWIKIDGVSSDTVGLYIDTPPVPPPARRRYSVYTTGSDEDMTLRDETFEDTEYSITGYVFKNGADYADSSLIYNYLLNASTLEISRLSGFYFKVRQAHVDVETEYDGNRIRYTANFVLAPFRYAVENPAISITSGDYIENKGNRYSKPTFKFSIQGNLTLNVNGESFQITNTASGYKDFTIETGLYTVYSGTEICPCVTTGKFPFFSPGYNRVIFSAGGNIALSQVYVNERWY